VKSLYSVHTRLRYALSPSLHISLGLSYLWKSQTGEYSVTYTRDEGWRIIEDVLQYPEVALEIKGYIPSIGIHYQFPVSRTLRLGCSFAGGPIFATASYRKEVNQSITSISSSTFPFWSSEQSMRMEGKGSGISLSGSVRLEQTISGSFGVSLESGYAWQRVKKIEGDGSETIDGQQTNFNGEWGLVEENVETAWGQARFIFPTNHWDVFGQKDDDFILDLSGFHIAVGLYLKF
jgi:hypothetical protein